MGDPDSSLLFAGKSVWKEIFVRRNCGKLFICFFVHANICFYTLEKWNKKEINMNGDVKSRVYEEIHSRFFRPSFCPGYLWINEENHDKIEAHETDRTD